MLTDCEQAASIRMSDSLKNRLTKFTKNLKGKRDELKKTQCMVCINRLSETYARKANNLFNLGDTP